MEPSNIHILVLDRDATSARLIESVLSKEGYRVTTASHETDALNLAAGGLFNIVVKSFDARRIDAVALMEKVRGITPDTQFIFISDGGTIHTAVDALRKGAFDYLSKPINPAQLIESVRKALDHQSLVAEDQQIKLRLRRRSDPDIFAGSSTAMKDISRLIQQIASTDVTVLIEGESGTGKEVVARAIHEKSRRKAKPFIAVNCAALPENLIEAELFGHVRGAFTGAVSDRKGRFQLAAGGTLFLDEIGDLSRKGQGDLLRVLEDGTFRPVGSQKLERATARIIAATNKDLETESHQGGVFREDLFYRLNIVSIVMPPLRERAEDIAPLVESFTAHFCAKHQRRLKKFKPGVVSLFQTLRWPGNVRQLRNLVERLVVTVPHSAIGLDDLPPSMHQGKRELHAIAIQPGMTLAQVEAELIRQTLLKVTSNREEAAKTLGISRRALQYKIQRYKLDKLPRHTRLG
ncbi:MAG: sigma-54-dependent Fis family transcriptional regulator [Prosthecobacter sp.]|jgi:DNA-binding NtrC family response regulator|uniref:sigma-54-dependent transcriptional regulator n=1 Tax=Prosthecobacter sp. TaxID=1965333 RepID=UPI0019E4C194|nr:sigma-54 dependent transcriptional regulator [Prosthecobacter sp.]MBE2281872.1 sigma-54-dependent Fis family transcriptional regulator [Prosthecobacter sp.]